MYKKIFIIIISLSIVAPIAASEQKPVFQVRFYETDNDDLQKAEQNPHCLAAHTTAQNQGLIACISEQPQTAMLIGGLLVQVRDPRILAGLGLLGLVVVINQNELKHFSPQLPNWFNHIKEKELQAEQSILLNALTLASLQQKQLASRLLNSNETATAETVNLSPPTTAVAGAPMPPPPEEPKWSPKKESKPSNVVTRQKNLFRVARARTDTTNLLKTYENDLLPGEKELLEKRLQNLSFRTKNLSSRSGFRSALDVTKKLEADVERISSRILRTEIDRELPIRNLEKSSFRDISRRLPRANATELKRILNFMRGHTLKEESGAMRARAIELINEKKVFSGNPLAKRTLMNKILRSSPEKLEGMLKYIREYESGKSDPWLLAQRLKMNLYGN